MAVAEEMEILVEKQEEKYQRLMELYTLLMKEILVAQIAL